MAPERIDPQTFGPISAATDLYAAGIILFELLAGRPPFRGAMTEIFTGHLMQPPDLALLPPGLPPGLSAMVLRALAKRSSDRYPDADAFLAALEAVARELAAAPPADGDATLLVAGPGLRAEAGEPLTLLDPAAPPRQNRRRLGLALGGALVLLVVLGLLLRWLGQPTAPPPDPQVVAPVAAETLTPAPATRAPAHAETVPDRNMTALQAVESARQPTTPAGDPAGPVERIQGSPQEWRVLDSQSRKLQ